MATNSSDGWDASAQAWIAEQGAQGDYGRRFVLDAAMISRICGREFRSALDVGCGEGRFCRIMRGLGLQTVGIDPTEALLQRARQLDPLGDYRIGRAESADVAGKTRFSIDHYLEERAIWVSWSGIHVQNWHRPLSSYMAALLGSGMELRYFAEPAPSGGDPAKAEQYRRVPYFHIMEWQKSAVL